jgi:histidinol-phosphatase (PHP family)
LGYDAIAITEHLDLLPQELTVFGIPSMTRYKEYLSNLRFQFPQLQIVFGIEIGDYHRVKAMADGIVQAMNFDLILGSVHFVDSHLNIAVPFDPPLSPELITDYYEQNLQLVRDCDIHILAHLGVYKRYYQICPDETHCQSLIDAIFKTMIQKGIALEINYSSFRKTYKSLLPEPSYMQRYAQLGGKLVSIGSDSHRLRHFDDNYRLAYSVVSELGFELLRV